MTKKTTTTRGRRRETVASARKLAAGRAALALAERATREAVGKGRKLQGTEGPSNSKADVWIRRMARGATSLFVARTERARRWVLTATDAEGNEGAFGLGAYVIDPSDESLMAEAARKAGLTVST
jgi:hypothetical protein